MYESIIKGKGKLQKIIIQAQVQDGELEPEK